MNKLLIVSYILLSLISICLAALDPYEVLGVNRRDSEKVIKAAYKRLALKLHPDKNSSPDAQSEMMEVNEAYEILSNKEKRKAYDLYGDANVSEPPTPQQHANFFHEFRKGPGGSFNFMFEDLPFGSNYRFHNYQRHNLLTRYNYHNIILPDSHHKLFLVYVVGEICFECLQLQSLWDKMSESLNNIGIGVYEMVYDRDRQFAYEIGINSYPLFFAVIKGRLVRYKGSEVREGPIRTFLSGLLPHYLIDYVVEDYREYFEQSFEDNKPQCLLFSRHLDPPLLFKAVAFEYHDKVKFGYVDIKDLRSKRLASKYDINITIGDPAVVLLKEEPSEPVNVLRGSALKRGALRKLVANNLYLNVPRLSNHKLFLDLCHKQTRGRWYCIILVLEKDARFSSSLWKFREIVKDGRYKNKHIQFTYMYEHVHQEYLQHFNGLDMYMVPCSDGLLPYKVMIISFKSEKTVEYDWFTNGWCGTDESVCELDKFILEHLSGEMSYQQTNIVNIVDEHYHGALWDFVKNVYHGVQKIVDGADSPSWFNVPSFALICLVILVMITFLFIPFMTYLANKSDDDKLPQHVNTSNTSTDVLGLEKLNVKSQRRFIHEAKPGKITVSIIVDTADIDHVTSSPIIQAFADVIFHYTSDNRYLFTWLSLAENANLLWCTEVMDVKEFGAFLPGTVLAMNGFRKYVYIFKPTVDVKDEPPISANFLGMESSDDECDDYEYLERIRYKKAALGIRKDLPMWLERLTEGTLPNKVKINEWPLMEE